MSAESKDADAKGVSHTSPGRQPWVGSEKGLGPLKRGIATSRVSND